MMISTVLPAKSDSDFMFCLQSYQGLIIDISLVYESYGIVIDFEGFVHIFNLFVC